MDRRWTWPLLTALALALVGVFGWTAVFASDPTDAPAGPTAADAPPPSAADSPAATAGLLSSPSPSPTPPPSRPAPAARPPRAAAPVLYLGDSLAMENQQVLAEQVRASGRSVLRSAPYSGTTLCDYLAGPAGGEAKSLVPARDKAAALVRAVRPRVVVLQFWGNSWGFTPCMGAIAAGTPEYYARYAADARTLTEQIAAAARNTGIPRPKIIWVAQGPDAFRPGRVRRVNAIYRAQAAATGDLVADAGGEVSPAGDRYAWARELPCNAYERAHPAYCTRPDRDGGTAQLHRPDDALHFCLAPTTTTPRPCPVRSPGIVRYCRAIAATVDGYLKSL
ncbi:SGNH/GDSL hydrolase family protein [Streptomyces sp. MST-110588]|uniref:SGNH/GDSL hydrolase family protein n=1 Tax=Streptomyces sp. MST-110588 TaxID=2833628 RepID=UPI001F5D74FE|nr:SGNH/GDSL hydrolase family protein [Streptomyces sp. MST-110588]UNO43463.1 SGNH/GDSL hydrolase family protein [Streptomyces sp. MST-110588]